MANGMSRKLMVALLAGAVVLGGFGIGSARMRMSSRVSATSSKVAATQEAVQSVPSAVSAQVETRQSEAVTYKYRRGNHYLVRYAEEAAVRQIILVEQSKENICDATLYLLVKDEATNKWQEELSCNAWIGKNGLGKEKEGDMKTPTGVYGFTMAFGLKDEPVSEIADASLRLPYTKVTDTMYVCGEKEYYNQFIDVKNLKHECAGEHLAEYDPQYNYALFIDYNKEGVYGKGSAIFLHVKGTKGYTMGCIGVDEEEMRKIVQKVDRNARICIYEG